VATAATMGLGGVTSLLEIVQYALAALTGVLGFQAVGEVPNHLRGVVAASGMVTAVIVVTMVMAGATSQHQIVQPAVASSMAALQSHLALLVTMATMGRLRRRVFQCTATRMSYSPHHR